MVRAGIVPEAPTPVTYQPSYGWSCGWGGYHLRAEQQHHHQEIVQLGKGWGGVRGSDQSWGRHRSLQILPWGPTLT